jgi:uncharacterized protein DUF3630
VPLPLEVLAFEPMASGHRSLRLTTEVSWEAFADYAEAVVSALGGTVEHRADSPAERVWSVTIDGASFWLSFDDFALGVSLDPCDAVADARIDAILLRLRGLVPGASAKP